MAEQIYSKISGLESVPTETSSSVLESLALLNKLSDMKFSDASLGFIAEQEMRYLKLAAKALSEDVLLKSIYGSDFQAIEKLSQLMKKRDQERLGTQSIDQYLSGVDANIGKLSPAEQQIRKTATSSKAIKDASSSSQ